MADCRLYLLNKDYQIKRCIYLFAKQISARRAVVDPSIF